MWILLSPGIFLGDPVRPVAMSRCELGGASSWRESFRSFELAANAVPIILEHGARRRIRIQSPSPLARRCICSLNLMSWRLCGCSGNCGVEPSHSEPVSGAALSFLGPFCYGPAGAGSFAADAMPGHSPHYPGHTQPH